MTKKKTMKNIKTPNKFSWGGDFKKAFNEGFSSFKDMFSGANMGKAVADALPGVTGAVGGLTGGLISDGFSTTGGQILNGIGDAAMAFNPLIGGTIKLVSGVVNRGFGTKWDQEGIAEAENQITGLNTFQSGASDFDTLTQDFNRINSMNKTIKASDLGEDGWFVNRTQTKANELNTDLGNAYNYATRNLNNVADNLSSNTLASLERKYAAFGGPLFAYGGQTHGADFTNGLMFINNGGTHESNPYEGIPISMDQEGNPNLVEEGEVIWNDYVFSNRLKTPKSIRKKYKLGKREMTFANAVDKLSKESEERPNDPISMRGLENVLTNMVIEQENIKNKKKINKGGNKFTGGGYSEPIKLDYTPEILSKLIASPKVKDLRSVKTSSNFNNNNSNWLSYLRYAPILGSLINVGTAFGQKPDYSNADSIINAAKTASTPIKFNPIGDYLTYNPFDTEYHANQLRAVSGATRRNVMNTSGGNRATAMAGILASDNNTMNQLGDLYRKAAEYNLEQRQKAADFNRATNMFNTEGIFKADAQNQQARLSGLNAIMQGYQMKEQIDANLGTTRSQALTGLFNNIGNVGIDALNRADRDMLIKTGSFGTLSEKPSGWSNKRWEAYKQFINN